MSDHVAATSFVGSVVMPQHSVHPADDIEKACEEAYSTIENELVVESSQSDFVGQTAGDTVQTKFAMDEEVMEAARCRNGVGESEHELQCGSVADDEGKEIMYSLTYDAMLEGNWAGDRNDCGPTELSGE